MLLLQLLCRHAALQGGDLTAVSVNQPVVPHHNLPPEKETCWYKTQGGAKNILKLLCLVKSLVEAFVFRVALVDLSKLSPSDAAQYVYQNDIRTHIKASMSPCILALRVSS